MVCLGSGTAVPLQARALPSFWWFKDVQGMGWHGRATAGTGLAKLLVVLGCARHGVARAVPMQARAVPSFWRFGSKYFFSVFLDLARTITYKTT